MSSHSVSLTKEYEQIAQSAASETSILVDEYITKIIKEHLDRIKAQKVQ